MLSITCWNINGLASKLTDPDFVSYITSFDICFLCETFTMPSFDFSVYFSDFVVLHSPGVKLSRMGRCSGGTVMLIKKSIIDYVTTVETHCENVLCCKLSKELFGCEKDVMFIGLYNHPVSSPYYNNKDYDCTLHVLEQFMLTLMESGEDFYCLIGGDLNSRLGDWYLDTASDDGYFEETDNTFERKSQDNVVNNFGKLLIQFCCMFQLTPLNGLVDGDEEGTFTFLSERGNSTIDFFITSVDFVQCVKYLSVTNRIESQHLPIQLNIYSRREDDRSRPNQEKEKAETLKWDPEKKQLFLDYLVSDEGKAVLHDADTHIEVDAQSALSRFVSMLLVAGQCMRRTVCVGARTQRSRWFDEECRKLKNKVGHLLSRYARTRKKEHAQAFFHERSLYNSMLNDKRKLYHQSIRTSLLENKNNSCKFWSTIKRGRPRKNEYVSISIQTWQDHFSRILGQQVVNEMGANSVTVNQQQEDIITVPELDTEISEGEVKLAIRKLKAGKAAGLYKITSDFF